MLLHQHETCWNCGKKRSKMRTKLIKTLVIALVTFPLACIINSLLGFENAVAYAFHFNFGMLAWLWFGEEKSKIYCSFSFNVPYDCVIKEESNSK